MSAVVFEVHVFLGTGTAKRGNEGGCKAGERHSLLIFSRQPEGQAPDEAHAGKGAALAGWTQVKVERSMRLSPGSMPSEATLRDAFRDALALGCTVVADRRALDSRALKPGKPDRRGKKKKA
jgi:hypothetical protein